MRQRQARALRDQLNLMTGRIHIVVPGGHRDGRSVWWVKQLPDQKRGEVAA